MSKEAMKMALDALEDLIPLCDPGFSVCYDVNKAITALREALAEQPAQQEPVGEIGKIILFGGQCKEVSWRDGKMPPIGSVLYTSPPAQRTWVGLTDEERKLVRNSVGYNQFVTAGEYAEHVQKATEFKLLEKNNG